ncbi:MAG: hypothetical protein GX767_08575 [Firmicutes bacterium]|nr:hypothetical protein [Bacillota bacterium]
MFRRTLTFLLVMTMLCVLLFAGCGPTEADEVENDDEIMAEQPDAKVDDDKESKEKEEEMKADETEEDSTIVNYELDVIEEWKGLKVEILGLALGEQVKSDYQEGPVDFVALQFRMENTRDEGEFTVYPDQGTLITSTGEQLEPDTWESDHIGGEIYEKVIKDGVVIWILERGHVFDLDWIRVVFNAYDEATDFWSDDYSKEFDLKIEIPQS